MKETPLQSSTPKRENMLVNLGFNLLLPILILRMGDDWFGPGLGKLLEGSPPIPWRLPLPAASCHSFSHKLRRI